MSPLIRRVVAENPGPFTYLGTGVYIIGRGEVAVIDPGPPLDTHFEALKRALAGERVTHVFTTHTHLDHSPLAHPLAQWAGCKVYGTPDPSGSKDHVSLEEDGEEGFAPDIVVKDGDVFTGPGWTLEAITTPGTCRTSLLCATRRERTFLWRPYHGVVDDGDLAADGNMGDYYRSLDKVKARGFATLWPTHGPPVTDANTFIDAYVAHRARARRRSLRGWRRGMR